MIYQPATVTTALQLSNGARVVTGNFIRANKRPATGLARYLAGGEIDTVFAANTAGYAWKIRAVAEASGGKLLVAFAGQAMLNGSSYSVVVRLNADGTRDAGFAAQPVNSRDPQAILVQPDDKVVVAGLAPYPGTTANGLVRLNADGTLDQSFGSNVGTGFVNGLTVRGVFVESNPVLRRILRQPDGKLLVIGEFVRFNGQNRNACIRLNADGMLDTAFAPPAQNYQDMALQSDGRIVLTSARTGGVLRLNSDGTTDTSFSSTFAQTDQVAVQPDGRILVEHAAVGVMPKHIVRLLSTGAVDPSWVVPDYGDATVAVNSLQVLPGGQVLVAGQPRHYTGATGLPAGLVVLSASGGAVITGLEPELLAAGEVQDLALQTDGRIILVGEFSQVNGTPAWHIARLNADGTVDSAFTANCLAVAPTGGASFTNRYRTLVQGDGKIVVSGPFSQVGGVTRPVVVRLLPSGQVDPGFTTSLPYRPGSIWVRSLGQQPNGQVLISGYLTLAGAGYANDMVRLTSSGQVDPVFQVPYSTFDSPFLVQSDGKILLTLATETTSPWDLWFLKRLLPSGATDAAYPGIRFPANGPTRVINGIESYADGRVLLYGELTYPGGYTTGVARFSATDALDTSFSSPFVQAGPGDGYYAVIQPNERILVANKQTSSWYTGTRGSGPASITRLLPNGTVDASFTVNTDEPTAKIVIQPNGAILIGGSFSKVGAVSSVGIARLLATDVLLPTARVQAEPLTQVYPNPARHTLHVDLQMAARPQGVELLDVMGRTVLRSSAQQASLTLPVTALPAGVYLLRVSYAAGPVTRRVVVE